MLIAGSVAFGAAATASSSVIHLNSGAIDTRSTEALSRRFTLARSTGKQLHLIQSDGPIQPAWLEALKKQGVVIIDYIPDHTYLVYADATSLQHLPHVTSVAKHLRWSAALRASEKIHPAARRTSAKNRNPAPPTGAYTIQLAYDPVANADTMALIDALKLEPVTRYRQVRHYINFVVRLPDDALDGIAGQPDVISITPYFEPKKHDERQGQIVAGNLSGNGPSGPGYLAWLNSIGFSQEQFAASGFAINISDSGVDNGSTNANHFGLYTAGNTALQSRVIYNRLEGSPNINSTLQGCDGHGTINAHIIGGYNDLSGFPHADSAGYRYGLGIVPFVNMGSSVIFDYNNFTNPDYSDLISRAYRDGARISSDSWGADNFGGYDADAQEYDALVRDAQPANAAVSNAGNQEMTIVFAAGNSGPNAQSIGSPGTAKNVITVGAAENVHSHAVTNGGNSVTGLDGCTTGDAGANDINDIIGFSSRGPTSDDRKKPEIVAPGTHITGGIAQSNRTMTGNGSALACFNGTGVCALPGGGTAGNTNNYFPLGQRWYSTSSGTSHSTPAVAGGVALIRQHFINQGRNAPSPAMVKAYLINSARYMTGASANDTLWSNHQGMGGMNLGTAFDATPRVFRDQEPLEKFTASGQTRTYAVVIATNDQPFRVTLSWTDAPGSTIGAAYNNDLNLTVSINGHLYRGNVFDGAFSITSGSADQRNNTESVFLPAGVTGLASVAVTAFNLNSDGVPNEAPLIDQDFALVICNAEEKITPLLIPTDASLAAENCGAGNDAIDPDETVSVRLAMQNAGSIDTTNIVATLLPTGGVTAPSGPVLYGALLAGGNTETNEFTFTADGTCGSIITATLSLQDGGTDLGSVEYTFSLGGSMGTTSTNTLSTTITIPAFGHAAPYPSTQTVSGLVGNIENVTVSVLGLSHNYPEDIEVLLVNPAGKTVLLMASAGGGSDINGVDLTFDDAATTSLPDENLITSGTYKPTPYFLDQTFGSPAPAGPYGTSLTNLNGTSANGTWKLFVRDIAADDGGQIASGWRLNISAGISLCCASNQPPVLSVISNRTVTLSNNLTFAVSASDPSDNHPITLTASNLPGGASFGATNGNGTFFWNTAQPLGVYTSTFFAADINGTVSKTVRITVNPAPINYTTNYIVTFEGSGETKLFYSTSDATLSGRGWTLNETLIGTSSSDRKNGARVARMRDTNSVMTMESDINRIDAVRFYHARYGSDTNSAVALDYSTNSGSAWINAGTVAVTSTNLTLYHTNINASGNVRIRIRKTSGSGDSNRANLEDIVLLVDGSPPQSPPVLVPIGVKSVITSNALAFVVSAIGSDGDAVTLTISNAPPGSTFGATNTLGTFTWPSASPVGIYTTRFYAADNDGSVSEAITITVANLTGGGTESFTSLNAPAGDYAADSYIGDGGILWSYRGATLPENLYFIDGQSIGFGNSVIGSRDLFSESIPGGVGTLSVTYMKHFTGAGSRGFELYVNDAFVGAVSDANNATPAIATFTDINIAGPVVIKLVSIGASQIVVDSLTWAGFIDNDNDGLLDQWEIANFGNLTNANHLTDSDFDYVTDHHEFLAGTQPTNAASYLRVADGVASPDTIVIQWPGVTGKSYTLSRTTNVIGYLYSVIATNIAGIEPLNTYTDEAPEEAGSVYRIELER